MTRAKLDSELKRLENQVMELSEGVEAALTQALAALETREQFLAEQVIAGDTALDALRREIEVEVSRLLTLQQPLARQELRFLISAFTIASSLERIGDGAVGIAKNFLEPPFHPDVCPMWDTTPLDAIGYVSEAAIIRSLLALGAEALRILHGTMQAFAARDTQAARALWQDDDVVDVRYHLVRHDLMNALKGEQAIKAAQRAPELLKRVTYYLWMAHKLERVADHCTNICERVVFLIEGQGTITYSPEE